MKLITSCFSRSFKNIDKNVHGSQWAGTWTSTEHTQPWLSVLPSQNLTTKQQNLIFSTSIQGGPLRCWHVTASVVNVALSVLNIDGFKNPGLLTLLINKLYFLAFRRTRGWPRVVLGCIGVDHWCAVQLLVLQLAKWIFVLLLVAFFDYWAHT